jgi:hypothetical protein
MTTMFQGDPIPDLVESANGFLNSEGRLGCRVSFATLFYEMRRRGFGQRRLADHLMWLSVNDPRVCDDNARMIRRYSRSVVSKYQDVGCTEEAHGMVDR